MPLRVIRIALTSLVAVTIVAGAAALAQGSRLVVSLDATPPHLDVMSNTTIEVTDPGHHVFENLFNYDASFRPQPMLAESFEVDDAGSVWTITIREGVRFHDGSIMTMADVQASFDRWVQVSNLGRAYADAEFQVVDDTTFRLVLASPRADLLDSLSDTSQAWVIIPAEIAEAAGADPLSDPSQWVGTGPFRFERIVPDEAVVLHRFDDYAAREGEPSGHGGRKEALVEVLEFRIITDVPTRTAALRSGEIDVIPSGVSGSDKPTLENDPNIEVQIIPGFQKWGPMFNGVSPIFDDPTMRRAVAASLDMEELALAMVGDPDLFDINPSLGFRGSLFYNEAGSDSWNLADPDRARELLDEAGYAGEEIVIISTQANVFQDRMATVMQAQMEDAGMNVRIDWYDGATIRQVRTQPDDWDIIPGGWGTTFNPAIYGQAFTCPSGSWTGICHPELDELFTRASQIVDLEERATVFEELQRLINEVYVPQAFIGDFMALRAYRADLDGVRPFKDFRAWGVSR
jgi:peptide/nickel transport system substrate-binding protein